MNSPPPTTRDSHGTRDGLRKAGGACCKPATEQKPRGARWCPRGPGDAQSSRARIHTTGQCTTRHWGRGRGTRPGHSPGVTSGGERGRGGPPTSRTSRGKYCIARLALGGHMPSWGGDGEGRAERPVVKAPTRQAGLRAGHPWTEGSRGRSCQARRGSEPARERAQGPHPTRCRPESRSPSQGTTRRKRGAGKLRPRTAGSLQPSRPREENNPQPMGPGC